MPDRNREIFISGETANTTSSDEHVRGLYESWRNQVDGVIDQPSNEDVPIVEGEIYAPRLVHESPKAEVVLDSKLAKGSDPYSFSRDNVFRILLVSFQLRAARSVGVSEKGIGELKRLLLAV